MIATIRKLAQYGRSKWTQFRIEKNSNKYKVLDKTSYSIFKKEILEFICTMRVDDEKDFFRFSTSCSHPTLYSSAYACMTMSLLGELSQLELVEKRRWADYFDGFQNPLDGLFYDPVVANQIYNDSDWWGARHLALHMINAYTDLGCKPKHQFHFLKKYYDTGYIETWLNTFDWNDWSMLEGDVDNKIMNIGCLLQYQRDTWKDVEAGNSLVFLKQYLLSKINVNTGMWGVDLLNTAWRRSRTVQFAYHLFPVFLYDGEIPEQCEKIVSIVLKTQNKCGGFGVGPNSSACEDIDSIDLLIRLKPYVNQQLVSEIDQSIEKAFRWVLMNKMNDGGFVFKLYESFVYGHQETSSLAGQGAMFPTWFRTLSVVYMIKYFNISSDYLITKCPGYEF